MPELADVIKELAHSVSEDYLLSQSNMNDAILLHASEKQLNEEIIKRICELANQNVYLSLFNDPSINKANIQFEMADFSNILNKLQKSEQDMKEYKIVPKGFKTQLGADKGKQEALENADFQTKKLAEFDNLQFGKNKYTNLLNSFETLKIASEEDTKESFNRIFNDTKMLVAQGDSVADLAKIAMRHVKSHNFDMIKIAKVYDMISTELKINGYTVNEELTKLSSLVINEKSKVLEPVIDYMLGLSKMAAFSEICDNIKSVIKLYDTEIEKNAGSLNSMKKNKKSIGIAALVGGIEGAIMGGVTGALAVAGKK